MKYPIEFRNDWVCTVNIEANSEEEALKIAEMMETPEVDDFEDKVESCSGWYSTGQVWGKEKGRDG